MAFRVLADVRVRIYRTLERRIAERGTHAELARAGGTYQRLWEASR